MDPFDGAARSTVEAPDALGSVPALRAVLEGLPDAAVAAGRDGRIVFANARAERLFGYEPGELLGRPVASLWPERMRDRYLAAAAPHLEDDRPLDFTTEAHGLRRDGTEFVGEMSWGAVETDAGPLLLAIGRDVSARRAALARLERQSAQQAAVAALGERALAGADPTDLARDAVERVRTALPLDRVAVRDGSRSLAEWSSGGAPVRSLVELDLRNAEETFGVLSAGSLRADAFGGDERAFLRAVATVLSAAFSRSRSEEKVRFAALHDPLTGLANRALCHDRIAHAVAGAQRDQGSAAVLFVDLDGFKRVNDSYGHATGDAVLVALARRLQATVRPADTVARLGGDEFVIVCDAIDAAAAMALAVRLGEAVHAPLTAAGVEHRLSASVGVALGDRQASAEALLADADAAAYRAKAHGRGRVEMFDAGLRERALEKLRTATALERALPQEQLRVAFQPIVALTTGAPVAFEALLRWDRPGGAPGPDEFIPLAEESALILEIGSWALREAAAAAAAARGAPEVWVNLSGRQLAHPGLPDVVARTLEATGLPPGRLRLELTETVLLHAAPGAAAALQRLVRLGARVVLDDFGTGESSLQHLRRFPVSGVKVDRSFVSGLEASAGDAAIVGAVISLAEALGLDVVAEGVETAGQAAVLRELGCPLVQGFLFGAPGARLGS